MIAAVCFALFVFFLLGLHLLTMRVLLKSHERRLNQEMSTLKTQLLAADQAVQTAVANLGQAVNDEIARVNATIAALQQAQNGGSVDDATVTQAIADLQTAATNLGNATAQLAGEDAAPASAPSAAGSSQSSSSSS